MNIRWSLRSNVNLDSRLDSQRTFDKRSTTTFKFLRMSVHDLDGYLQSELVINVDILEWYTRTIMSQEIVYEKWDECCWSLVPTNRRTSFTTKKSFDLGFQRFKWSNRRLFKSSEVHEIEVHKIRVHDTRVHDTRVYDKRVHDKRVYNKRVSRYDSRVHYMNLSE